MCRKVDLRAIVIDFDCLMMHRSENQINRAELSSRCSKSPQKPQTAEALRAPAGEICRPPPQCLATIDDTGPAFYIPLNGCAFPLSLLNGRYRRRMTTDNTSTYNILYYVGIHEAVPRPLPIECSNWIHSSSTACKKKLGDADST